MEWRVKPTFEKTKYVNSPGSVYTVNCKMKDLMQESLGKLLRTHSSSLSKYLLNKYHVPGIMLAARERSYDE